MRPFLLCLTLGILSLCPLPGLAAPPPPEDLSIRVLEGEGAVYPAGAFSARRIVVEVRSRSGKPASGVNVTFRLPREGSTGRFASGLASETVLTSNDGRASVSGIQWNQTPGAVEIRVVAERDGVRAEAVIAAELSASARLTKEDSRPGSPKARGGKTKWIVLVAAMAGGAAGGLAAMSGSGKSSSAPAPPAPGVVPPAIGAPSIVIGRP